MLWCKNYGYLHKKGYMVNMDEYKKILISRTDRLGDVVLSTPVIKSLRQAYPNAYIAMMVRPYTVDIVAGNPDLNEVIICDKKRIHKSWLSSIRFAYWLKRKQFDLVLILHSTNRVNLISWLARIKRRVGWSRKMGFLLTDKLPYLKRKALKHEMDYNFEMLEYLNIPVVSREPVVYVPEEIEEKVRKLLEEEGIKETDKYIAVHPDASCRSKKWPLDRFEALCAKTIKENKLKCVIIGGPGSEDLGKRIKRSNKDNICDLTGKLTIKETAAVLKNAAIVVSNDSGPVHLATAVGTPVIAIFGRKHKDLGPNVWGPVGKNDIALQKDVGCEECLPHDCPKNYECLNALTVDEVYSKIMGSGLNI
ncbi:MAG: lipopolysaccharide heptosyltransferase II [Candidatus Theseobacter exili]|nr:lipopolysaccharide heptosyltransferase II [Candidatus Theseobacter exili]